MSIIRKNGNKIEFFNNDLIYGDFEYQDYIYRIFTEEEKIYKKRMNEVKKEKLKCFVTFNFIDNIEFKNENDENIVNNLNCEIDFENDDIQINVKKFDICFTENHLIFYLFDIFENKTHFELFNFQFNDELKQEIINYFSKSFLEEYQIEIYKKLNLNKYVFGIDLIKCIIYGFIISVKDKNNLDLKNNLINFKEQIDDKINNITNRLDKYHF